MPILTPVSTLPLGEQLRTVNHFVGLFGQQPRPSNIKLAYHWELTNEEALHSYGKPLPDISVISDPAKIPSFVADVRSLSRGIFDPQIEQLSKERLTHHLVESKELWRANLKEAIDLETVSRGPAEVLMESLRVYKHADAIHSMGKFSALLFLGFGGVAVFALGGPYFRYDFEPSADPVDPRFFMFPLALLLGSLGSGIVSLIARSKIAPMFKAPKS